VVGCSPADRLAPDAEECVISTSSSVNRGVFACVKRLAWCLLLPLYEHIKFCERTDLQLREGIMSERTIRKRAADIRKSWTKNERHHRALSSQRRCLDLLVRISTAAWSGKQPA
jgi:hypothetical protein